MKSSPGAEINLGGGRNREDQAAFGLKDRGALAARVGAAVDAVDIVLAYPEYGSEPTRPVRRGQLVHGQVQQMHAIGLAEIQRVISRGQDGAGF